jgi:hypothetical protein
MINDDAPQAARLRGRLHNGKFATAADHLEGQPPEVVSLVRSLAAMFGNTGWILGDMGVVVDAALRSIEGEGEGA